MPSRIEPTATARLYGCSNIIDSQARVHSRARDRKTRNLCFALMSKSTEEVSAIAIGQAAYIDSAIAAPQ
jgi:hypothetical protein